MVASNEKIGSEEHRPRVTELDEIKGVIRYFADRERRFEGEHALNAARNLVNARNEEFNELIAIFHRFRVEAAGGVSDIPPDLRACLDAISQAFRQELSAQIRDEGAGVQLVVTSFPLSSEEKRSELIMRLSTVPAVGLISVTDLHDANRIWNLLIAGLLRSWVLTTGYPSRVDQTRVPATVWAAYARIEAYEFSVRWKKELIGEATEADREVGLVSARVREAAQRADNLRESIDRAIVDLDGHGRTVASISAQVGGLEEKASKSETDLAARYESWAVSTDERLKLRHAGKLWGDRAFWARISWGVSFVGVLALIVGVPGLGYMFKDEILKVVEQFQPATAQTDGTIESVASNFLATASHLLLVTAPLAFLVWGIRFLIRYNMRSQLLMDDATQRRTMLETYFMLVEKGISDPKADRAVLLEAMFRPAPGHGSEAAEPMNFAELLKLGEQAKK